MTWRAMLIGAIAGAISALVFTIFHGLMINSIWFMLVPMLIAGAICGVFLGWSYVLLVDKATVGGWLRYNALYLILLFMLGPISLLIFEPMITIPALLDSPNGLPAEMVRGVRPLAAVYTLFMALFITMLYGRRWIGFPAVLITSAALMMLLGLNIALMGLVYLTDGWLLMLFELLVLILALNFVYVLTFAALGYGWLWRPSFKIFST